MRFGAGWKRAEFRHQSTYGLVLGLARSLLEPVWRLVMKAVRVFLSFVFCLAIMAANGCDGKSKKIAIHKKSMNPRSESDKVLDQLVRESKGCLPLKRVADHFRGQEEKVYSLYTYDVDVGQPVTLNEKAGGGFTSSGDIPLRAQTAIFFMMPRYVFGTGRQLSADDAFGVLLNVVSQDECKEFHIQGQYEEGNKSYDLGFRISSSSRNHILARNPVTGEIRSYHLTNNSELEITRYWTERLPICGKTLPPGQVIKETMILSWNESQQQIRIRRPYAQLLATYIQEPGEVKDKLNRSADTDSGENKSKQHLKRPKQHDPIADSISISYPVYFAMLKEISQHKVENLTCN
jgi:hypothetical protein